MISASELKKGSDEYQELLNMVEDKIKRAAANKQTYVVIDFKKYRQYDNTIVAELKQHGYYAEVMYQNTMMGRGVNLHVSWNRDTSKPVTWWDAIKYNLDL